ncbi:zinc-ribbon domain-containing protein [Cohnella phaseoli]|uniref:Zinc ribbon protein n=1 Tax=Cohnella phaseoli TaxID=456490 RepID=A0A3D9KRG8_9BACL|nr:zinc-ribbon domain-containing protein [Cohnella phaseoli]RED89271.1 zinc ribbon protein [Cohnella phaseoli]
MFCLKCGTELPEGSKFCNHCGASLAAVGQTEEMKERTDPAGIPEENETAVALDPALNGRGIQDYIGDTTANPASRKRVPILVYVLPIVSLVIVAALLGSIYAYQKSVNRQVEELLQQGEQLALDGKLAEGKAAIEKALEKRPDHRVLLADQKLLTDAIALQARLDDADKQRKGKKFDEAIKEIDSLQKELASRSGPVFQKLVAAVDTKKEEVVVEQVVAGLPAKKAVEELAPLFNVIRDYKGEAAQKAANQIKQKIADIAYEKASAELSDKQFANALVTLEEALKFDESNKKLTTLKTTVEQKKQSFEEAENRRIEEAIEKANQEDLANRTEAVELVSVDAFTDEYGYFIVEGTIKNRATRSISSVLLYFDILDESGEAVDQASVYVSPEFLASGDEGDFYAEFYNYEDNMSSVNVNRAEWQLN